MAQAGGKLIDTARGYGRAEVVIGELLASTGLRDHYFISTKTPMGGDLSNPDAVLQTSFDQLQVDTIDLMLIHNLYGLDELMPAFIKAKEDGRIRYIGMSTSTDNQYEAQMAGMRKYPLDFIQVDYSLGNRSAEQAILPLAQERGMAVLANTPFGGRRNASTTFGAVSGVALPDWAAGFDATSWAQVFLKYVVSHHAITAAIPGTVKASHVETTRAQGGGVCPTQPLAPRSRSLGRARCLVVTLEAEVLSQIGDRDLVEQFLRRRVTLRARLGSASDEQHGGDCKRQTCLHFPLPSRPVFTPRRTMSKPGWTSGQASVAFRAAGKESLAQ